MTVQAIHKAARRADRDALRRELAKGVSPNALGHNDQTPLHYLCRRDNNAKARDDCLRMLLEVGADIHAPTRESQNTPLHLAAGFHHANVVAALLKAGADVNRGNSYDATPLHQACARSDSDVEPAFNSALMLLIRNGADLNARDYAEETPLDILLVDPPLRRLVPILLRAGAALPAETDDAYIQKVMAAGGFGRHHRNHLDALAETFTPKLAHLLPPEIVRLVVKYAFHVGYY